VLVGSLIGAIVAGGALAIAYKKLLSDPSTAGRTPVVVTVKAPVKTKPADPGGREVPHQDNKFLNKLGDPLPAPTPSAPAATGDADGSPRRVALIPIGPGAPAVAPPPPAIPAVPGLILQDAPRPVPPPAAAPPPAVPAPPAAAAPPPAAAPTLPPARAATAVVAPRPAPPPPAPVVATPSPPTPLPRTAAVTPPPAAPAAAPTAVPPREPKKPIPREKTTTTGWVVVAASRKTPPEAAAALAEMKQKHGEALGDKTLAVVEANLADKGLWYRVIAGPPSSKESADEVCTKLKAQNVGCWTMRY
jgi:hypothetical protein